MVTYWKKLKAEKLLTLTNCIMMYGRKRKTYFFDYANREQDNRLHPSFFLKKCNLGITKKDSGVTLNSVFAKVFNCLLQNHYSTLGKIKLIFREIDLFHQRY